MAAAGSRPRSLPPAQRLGRLATGTFAFVLAGLLGRATIIDGEALSLIWPAAGIAALWIGSAPDQRTRLEDLGALAAATFLVNFSTGAGLELGWVFVITNVAQVCAFILLVRSWIPGLWGFGGTRPLNRLADLGSLSLAAVVSCLLGATLGAFGLEWVSGSVEPSSFMVWWGRNSVAIIVVVTLCLLVCQPLATAGSRIAAYGIVHQALSPSSRGRALEAGALIGSSAGLYVVLFLQSNGRPLAFLILVMSLWAGLRFSPVVVILHGLAMSAAGIAFTLAGVGPFAVIESLHYRALVAQVFVVMAVLTGLALAFSRSERDQAHRELSEARRAADERAHLLDAVLESMKEGVVVYDQDRKVLVRNTAALRLLGIEGPPRDTVQDASAYGMFHASGLPVTDAEMPGTRALAGETIDAEDFHVRAASVPQGRVIEVGAHPLESTDPDAPLRAMVNVRDVTLDRQHRDTLASFAGVVAHDLFNPLSLVEGWTENLETEFANGPVPPAVGMPMVARIHQAADHMGSFIGDLLSYTVARDQSLRPSEVDLSTLLRRLARLRAEGPSAPVIAVADDLTAWVDEGLVRQLFDNLLGNAIKYVDAGVRPAVDVAGTQQGDWLEVRVTDNGIGIPREHRAHVFETFHRAHPSYHGTGLGLAICARIVDRHGGTIRVEDGPNRIGSTFVLTLPTAPVAVPVRV